jgi:nicotinamide-nucleotide amidase
MAEGDAPGRKGTAALVAELARAVKDRDLLLAVAESCTGGMLAAAIVADEEASPALERGFVVYSVDAKCELLGLERQHVEECAGVAEDIARGMARAALAQSHADLAAAITGFAGPRQGDEEVGLVHIATATRDDTDHRMLRLGDVGRLAVCEESVRTALEMLVDGAARISDRPSASHS